MAGTNSNSKRFLSESSQPPAAQEKALGSTCHQGTRSQSRELPRRPRARRRGKTGCGCGDAGEQGPPTLLRGTRDTAAPAETSPAAPPTVKHQPRVTRQLCSRCTPERHARVSTHTRGQLLTTAKTRTQAKGPGADERTDRAQCEHTVKRST